ncbi:MAG: DUF4410 domain-containing protein [Nitrospinae bacterium]|nr:DUF4410 domain-containing protein [Nitrospinota bacterium]MBI3815170.1 DUF4410 domain-containing protein [Nitrospinota bacterium]
MRKHFSRINCNTFKIRIVNIFVISMFFMVGCSGTTPLVLKPTDMKVNFLNYKSLEINTSVAEGGVVVSETAQNRIKEFIKVEINNGCCKNRFENILFGPTPAQPEIIQLNIKFRKYDEGNRFLRSVLIGLGAMEIHADVEIRDAMSGKTIGKGEAGKTYAVGGLAGAATGIEYLEKEFAKEVSKALGKMMGI